MVQMSTSTEHAEHIRHSSFVSRLRPHDILWLMLMFCFVARPLPENGSVVAPRRGVLSKNKRIFLCGEKEREFVISFESQSTHSNDTDWW